MKPNTPNKRVTDGFTLIELLTVIAIISILAAILIPAVGVATDQVKGAQTRSFFNQIATAINEFKNVYGYYPTFGGNRSAIGNDTLFVLENSQDTDHLLKTLAGRDYNGIELSQSDAAIYNPKRRQFMTFVQNNFATDASTGNVSDQIGDAFGNTNIVIIMDNNKDGILPSSAFATAVSLADASVSAITPEVSGNVYATVAIYSAGNGEIIATWE
ncbi:MAG: prepilin-type N-terminal cleavage/methylation domain-containing protein [Verrucomicrobiota bacterium]